MAHGTAARSRWSVGAWRTTPRSPASSTILAIPDDTVFRLDDVRRFPLNEVMLITTGSQGEPSSVLSRIATGDHRQIKIMPG